MVKVWIHLRSNIDRFKKVWNHLLNIIAGGWRYDDFDGSSWTWMIASYRLQTRAVFQYPYYPYSYYLLGRSNSNWGKRSVLEEPGWCTQSGQTAKCGSMHTSRTQRAWRQEPKKKAWDWKSPGRYVANKDLRSFCAFPRLWNTFVEKQSKALGHTLH